MSTTEIAKIEKLGNAPYLVFADHASNFIPEELNDLGLPEDVLETHIDWDIGAGPLAAALGQRLQATVLSCQFSRLIVDANRDISTSDLIPATSDQIPIPGNQMLSESDRQGRIQRFYDPYHEQLSALVESMAAEHDNLFVVSVHSFTRRMMGALTDRPWHIGMLWREDPDSAQAVMDWLAEHSDWEIGDNQPYDARVFNYSIDRHIGSRGLRHLTFEVRQDMLCEPTEVQAAATTLANAIEFTATGGK